MSKDKQEDKRETSHNYKSDLVSDVVNSYTMFYRKVDSESKKEHEKENKENKEEAINVDGPSDVHADDHLDVHVDESTIKCLFSLTTPGENDRVLDWFNVRALNGVFTPYLIHELDNYFHKYRGGDVPDPIRALKKLNHLRCRIKYVMRLPSHVREIKAKYLTDDFVMNCIEDLVIGWKTKKSDLTTIPEMQFGIFMHLGAWEKAGYVHYLDVGGAVLALKGKSAGSFLIRKSSQSIKNDYCTIYSISVAGVAVNHGRYLDIHGVGIYSLTSTVGNKPAINLNQEDIANNKFEDIMQKINYAEPHFPCFVDMLCFLERSEVAFLRCILSVDDLKSC